METRIKPYEGDEPYIFISYSHKNKADVVETIRYLSDSGYRIWYDEGIDPGTEWDENIASHVENCYLVIAFLSQEYVDSDNCRDELNYARDLDKERILIYLYNNFIEKDMPSGMRMRLGRLQSIHKYAYANSEEFYAKIMEATVIKSCKMKNENDENERSDGSEVSFAKSEEERNQEAPEIKRDLSKTNKSAQWAMDCNDIGEIYYEAKKYKAAEDKYQEALEIYRELSKTNRSAYIGEVANSCYNLGILYYKVKKYKEAEENWKEALEIYRELSKTNRSAYIGDVAASCHYLGALYYAVGNYKDAEEKLQEALEIYRDFSKIDRSEFIRYVAYSCYNLGVLYLAVGRYDEAKEKCQEALRIYEELNEKSGADVEAIKELSGYIAWLNKQKKIF